MRLTSFAIWLFATGLTAFAVFGIFKIYFPFAHALDVFAGSLLFFIIFSIVLYAAGLYTIKRDNLNAFSGIVILSMLTKLLLAVILVILLKKTYSLSAPIHILPFLINYVAFTVFEVYFMSVIAKKRIYKS